MLELDLKASGRPPEQDAFLVQQEVVKILRKLRPHSAVGHRKVRFGGKGDGGYVCIDDFADVNVALSLGINTNVTWDEDIANRGLVVHQFDHTVDDPRPADHRLIFNKLMISDSEKEGSETLDNLVKIHDKNRKKPNVLLKIDIENDEWPVLDALDPSLIERFSQIVGEFHAFEFVAYPEWRARCRRVIDKITDRFALVHVHANNYASCTTLHGVTFPNVLELTFANRNIYDLYPTIEIFPGHLDTPCNPKRPDIHLGSFTY